MPLNLNPELVPTDISPDPKQKVSKKLDWSYLKTNQRAIARHLTDDHYIRGFTPAEFVLADAGVTLAGVPAATPRWPALVFADAVTSRAVVAWRKPSEWRSGKMRVRIWYTSDVGSTNNFQSSIRLNAIRDSEVLPGTALLAALTNTIAGPAVADTVIRASYTYSTTSLGGDDELFSMQLGRIGGDAADTNTNDLMVLYAEVEHIPGVQEAT